MDEINDIGNVIANTIDNKGEDKRNFFGILRAQRGATDLYNISGDSLNLLNEAYKSNKIGADEYKEGLRNIIEASGNDLGLNVSLVYLDTSTMPKDSERSTGSSYIVDRKNRKVLIPIDVNKIEDIKELLGTVTEEVAHGKDALEGRQDKKVAEDKSNDEEGLETLGRPANEYVKKKFGEDNNSKIKLTTDGIDLSNADVGEKVGDVITSGDRVFRTGYQSKYKYIQMDFDRAINGMLGLTGSVFRGAGSYVFIKTGVGLLLVPEPTLTTKIAGVVIIGYGVGEAIFSFLDGAESGQDVYYGVTNQRDKKSVNFGKNFLGEEEYMILNATSGAGAPMMYYFSDYARVMAEGEVAQKASTSVNTISTNNNKSTSVSKASVITDESGVKEKTTDTTQKKIVSQSSSVSKKKSTNTDSYVTGIKKDKPNTFLNGTKFKELEPKSGKVENLSELLTDEGIAKLKNMTIKEIKELFEKEGLNPTNFDRVNGTGKGQKFSIPNNKFMIPADFEKGKRKMITIGSVRTNSGASHGSLPYILFGTNDGKYKIVFGDPKDYKYNITNKENANIIFVNPKR